MPTRQRPINVHLNAGLQAREYAAIADRIAADAPGQVLDWGCGFGQMADLLDRRGVPVTLYDYRPTEPPGRRPLLHHPRLLADVGDDPVRLPYEDDRFDAVLSCGVLEHVSDPDASLDELRRVLRPGGRLYVYKLPNRFSYLEAIAKRMGLYYHGSLPDDRLYTLESARSLLERHSYSVRYLQLSNLLPLTLAASPNLTETLWRLNRRLGGLPGVSKFATNIELIAEAPRRTAA
jgi:SAM-dependent methyltransferase